MGKLIRLQKNNEFGPLLSALAEPHTVLRSKTKDFFSRIHTLALDAETKSHKSEFLVAFKSINFKQFLIPSTASEAGAGAAAAHHTWVPTFSAAPTAPPTKPEKGMSP